MTILIIYLLWYTLFAKRNPKLYNKIHGVHKKIVWILIAITMFSSVHFSLEVTATLMATTILLSPVIFIAWIISVCTKKLGQKKEKNDYYETYSKAKSLAKNLTQSVPKRKKIVESFSDKYRLNLTEAEVDKIVNASYMSYGWEKEIIDMDREYVSVAAWYDSETNWLRAYFRVFPVQSVSTDFNMQKTIVFDSFCNIFESIIPEGYGSVDECINAINNRYMTAFDDMTFMIAYRFLQVNGRTFKLPKTIVVNSDADIDSLKKRYDNGYNNSGKYTPGV